MSERAPVLVDVGGGPRPGPGAMLQAARVERGLQIDSVASALHVPPRIIEALEGDRFEVFDAPVYARGFLRTYSRFVGLSTDDVLAAYDALAGQQAEPSLIPPTSAGPLPRDFSVLKIVLALGLALLLVGASYWWWLTRNAAPEAAAPAPAAATAAEQLPLASVTPDTDVELPPPPDSTTYGGTPDGAAPVSSTPSASVPASAPAPVAVAPAAAASTAAPRPTASLAKPELQPAAATAVPTTPLAKAPVAATPPAAAPAPAARAPAATPAVTPAGASPAPTAASVPAGPHITLRGKADCWVEVRGAGGVRLFYDLVRAGQTHTINGPAPWFVFLGYADGVELSVDGHPVDVPASRHEGVKARFGLNADGTVR
jgi:cytoskeleton protein RodZ